MDKVLSYAKINLFLRIIGRDEHYHQLQSLMQTISLADEITFQPSKVFEVKTEGVNLDDNIIEKAYQLLKNDFDISPLKITVKKNIPLASGLGGGSSNAAATLNYLNRRFRLNLSKEKLKRYAELLGADVPFFIEGGTQLIGGRGEICQPVSFLPAAYYVLVNPKVACSTTDVYKNFSQQNKFSQDKDYDFLKKPYTWQQLKPFLANDLEQAAQEVVPEIQAIIKELKRFNPLYAGLSGSGATCFGIFLEKEQSAEAHKFFIKKYFSYLVQANSVFKTPPP